jgi:hypothetical protein
MPPPAIAPDHGGIATIQRRLRRHPEMRTAAGRDQEATPMRTVIAGAGIGGLTTALALHQVGIEAEVFEQTSEVRELGVGITLLPHAVKALAALGLLPALDRAGIRTRREMFVQIG